MLEFVSWDSPAKATALDSARGVAYARRAQRRGAVCCHGRWRQDVPLTAWTPHRP
jgi:hypothetical protein